MAEDNLVSFVLDQLNDMGDIRARRMFGGWHLSHDGVFFGAVHKERLYFKTSDKTRGRYDNMGMHPFRPRGNLTLKTLYEVPIDVIEEAEELITWAMEAVDAQIEIQLAKEISADKKNTKNSNTGDLA
jgi:DNA transformation protein